MYEIWLPWEHHVREPTLAMWKGCSERQTSSQPPLLKSIVSEDWLSRWAHEALIWWGCSSHCDHTAKFTSSHRAGRDPDGGAVLLIFILFILLETVSRVIPGLLLKKHLHFDPPYTPQRAMKATMLRSSVNRMCYQRFRKPGLGSIARPRLDR